MTRVLVVALGPPSAQLETACRPGGQFAGRATIDFRAIALDVAAVQVAPIPPAFALAWIFVDRSMLDDPALRACQQRLSLLAPVTIAVYLPADDSAWVPGVSRFAGSVFVQPYSDVTFAMVVSMISGFAAKERDGPSLLSDL